MNRLEYSEREQAGTISNVSKAKRASKYAVIFAIAASIGASVLAQAGITETGFKSKKGSRIEEIAKETDKARAEKTEQEAKWGYFFDTDARVHLIAILGDLDKTLASEIANSRGEIVIVMIGGNLDEAAAKELCGFKGERLIIDTAEEREENVQTILENCPTPSTHASYQLSHQSTP